MLILSSNLLRSIYKLKKYIKCDIIIMLILHFCEEFILFIKYFISTHNYLYLIYAMHISFVIHST